MRARICMMTSYRTSIELLIRGASWDSKDLTTGGGSKLAVLMASRLNFAADTLAGVDLGLL